MCNDEGIVEYEQRKDGNVNTHRSCLGIVIVKVLDWAFIKRANVERFGDLLKDLRKQQSYGQDLHPYSVEVAHSILNKHELVYAKRKKPVFKGRGGVREKGEDEPRGKYQGQKYEQ